MLGKLSPAWEDRLALVILILPVLVGTAIAPAVGVLGVGVGLILEPLWLMGFLRLLSGMMVYNH